jgi:spermidine synthase
MTFHHPDLEYLSSCERSIGLIYLCRHPRPSHPDGWVYDVYIDAELLMSSVSPLSERQLATLAIAAHRGEGPLRVLVGGLGLGYTAQAALESPRAATVRVVDRMDFVIQWIRDGLLPLSEQLNADERLELVQSDVYADLLAPASRSWDLILMDVDHSPEMPLDPASLPFYTPEGQTRVREHLAPGGVLAVWSAHDNDRFAAVLSEVYDEAWREEIAWSVEHDGEETQDFHNVLFMARRAP